MSVLKFEAKQLGLHRPSSGKDLPASAGNARDTGLIPGSGRSPGVGNGNPFQYSGLENSVDRRAWQATVHGVKKIGQLTLS